MITTTKKILILFIAFILTFLSCGSSNAYDIATKATTDISQARQFLTDRHASKKMMDSLDFIYDYCAEIGIDPTLVVAISSIETGYGKSNLFVNYNNPGGIKARSGWKRFNTIEDGYRYMIRLLATYAGLINENSWLYGKATTTQQLGNYYWVENGCDRGYHSQLTRQIKTIQSYKVIKNTKKDSKDIIDKTIKNKKTSTSIINDILKRKSNKNNTNSLDLIYNSLKK